MEVTVRFRKENAENQILKLKVQLCKLKNYKVKLA